MPLDAYRFGGSPLPVLKSEKANLVLEFLVENRGTRFERKHLEAAFWPDKGPVQAQQNLRQALFKIGEAFEDHSPIAAKRTVVYCRASDIYEVRSARKEDSDYEAHGIETQIHTDFGSVRVDQFLSRITTRYAAVDTALKDFYLACAYNELGMESSALEVSKRLLARAKNAHEQANAHHSMGAMLWHSGEFEAGIKMLWEAASIADCDSPVGQHIISNIAIGEHERGNRDGFEYALAQLRLADASYSLVLKSYLMALGANHAGHFEVAENLARQMLASPECANCRIKVYFLEVLAHSLERQGRPDESRQVMLTSRALRDLYAMVPSRTESRRLGKLRERLNRG